MVQSINDFKRWLSLNEFLNYEDEPVFLLMTPFLVKALSGSHKPFSEIPFTIECYKPMKFDADLAVALGAHAFDTYNDPSLGSGKQCFGEDGTLVTFHSTEFVQRACSGVVIGTLRNGNFRGVGKHLL